ncbi:hypothetical protein MY5147_009747 [Beauveria neobassiana]
MPLNLPHDGKTVRGQGRRRSSKGSNDIDKGKAAKPPSQKAMLSRALQKANTAVQLDNAQNLEGARTAYAEACDLLQQVLRRTSGDEDKRKLEAIRQTYSSRIEELDQIELMPNLDTALKALPARPGSDEYSPELAQNQYSATEIASTITSFNASPWVDGSNTNRTLDAAIEAAYDDGYEPMGRNNLGERDAGEEAVARVLRKVEIARERVRQTEQETLSFSNSTGMTELLSPRHYKPTHIQNDFYDDDSSDDEERMLEEMARDYDIGDFTMNEAVPIIVTRGEDFRPSTRQRVAPEQKSQVEPVRPLMEKKSFSSIIKGLGPSLPPPNTSLPDLPSSRGTSPMQTSKRTSVRLQQVDVPESFPMHALLRP